jgi:fructuronate reductase
VAQIAADGSAELAVRTLPVLLAERAAGRIPVGGATTVAAWVLHLRGRGAPVKDVGADRFVAAAVSTPLASATSAVIDLLEPGLGRDHALVDAVVAQADALLADPTAR